MFKGNPTLPKFTGVHLEFFSGFLKKYIIIMHLKGKMPLKMHKIIFFFQKKNVPTLPIIFRPVTQHIYLFGLNNTVDRYGMRQS